MSWTTELVFLFFRFPLTSANNVLFVEKERAIFDQTSKFFMYCLINERECFIGFKAGFPLANIFARSDFSPLSLSFRLKPSGTNKVR